MARRKGAYGGPAAMTAARLLIGAIFLASGVGKLLEPAGQFAHILGAYRLVPQAVIPYVATWLPWGELILGTYLVSGFETRWSALVSAGFFAIFSAALATNLVLGIPLEECGCFGVFLKKEGAVATLVGDLLLLGISLWLVRRPVSRASLDGWLEAKGW